MKLTQEQKAAAEFDGNLMLTACPGSGKTRVVISKLSRLIDGLRDTPRSVACITYTNTAVHEIESRIQIHLQPGDDKYFEVSTIHSFCLNNIFRPFCHLVDGFNKGFRVLTPEREEFEEIVTATCEAFNRYNLSYSDFDEFTKLRLDLNGNPVGSAIEQGSVTAPMAREFWKRVQKAGFIDFTNIIYHSYCLLRDHPEILDYVASKFAWVIVDEFQDTTDLQVEILSLIDSKKRTKFLLVGDPHQSIFRFAGARPDLADKFAKRIKARTDLTLSGNFRSSIPIVKHANVLFPRTPTMEALGGAKRFTEEPEWRHGNQIFEVITDYFLPTLEELEIPIGEAAILAPAWFTLFPLGRSLREYGVAIVGPGARPYRRNRQFAPLAEAMCGYLMEPIGDSIILIEKTLFNTLLDVTGRANFDLFSYKGRLLIFELIAISKELYERHESAAEWLEAAAAAFTEVLIAHGYFAPSEKNVFAMSVEEMKTDMRNNKVDINNLTVDDLGVYASPNGALKLATLHNSKGREFSAVAMIDLHEGRIPSYYSATQEDFAEQMRLFYVGITRAKRFLMYVTDSSHRKNTSSRYLGANGLGIQIIR